MIGLLPGDAPPLLMYPPLLWQSLSNVGPYFPAPVLCHGFEKLGSIRRFSLCGVSPAYSAAL